MKKKRGFTLIELIAVIVVLGVILAIAVPTITSVIKKASMNAFASDAKIVLKALDYKKMEIDNFDPTSVNKSTIESLLKIDSNNYSSLNIVLEESIPVISIIGTNKWEGFIACGTFHNMKVVENATDCNDDNVYPELTMLGTDLVSIFINQTYTDAGATASDNIDGNMTSKIIITSNVNTNLPGSYTVTYSVTDSAGNNTTLTRTVNVIDNASPTVTFGTNGNSTYAKTRSTTVTVSDPGGINTSSLKYLWNTSTTTPTEATFSTNLTNGSTISTPTGVTGGYYLWILGKDTVGNTAIIRSNVFNLDNTPPTITITGSNPSTVIVGSVYTDAGATATDSHSGINGSVASTSNVNTNVSGTYSVIYNVSDNANNTATITRTVNVISSVYTYDYIGAVQTFIVPATGNYKLEVWGAQGGGPGGGKGGYATGIKYLTAGQTLYAYVGGTGGVIGWNDGYCVHDYSVGGWNGGSWTRGYSRTGGGGGATDFRLTSTNLTDRIIVAGGGGGQGSDNGAGYVNSYGGSGGGEVGGTGDRGGVSKGGTGGTQTAGGNANATLGVGGPDFTGWSGGGGGGGYYGGGGGNSGDTYYIGGGGGSGYIGGVTSGSMQSGIRTGNGYAKITYMP